MKNNKTYEQQFKEALACNDRIEAQRWLADEIERYVTSPDFLGDRESARDIILNNIGYVAGYYDQATSQKIYDLFGAEHPLFGKPDYWVRITPEDAFNMGVELAEKWKKEHPSKDDNKYGKRTHRK